MLVELFETIIGDITLPRVLLVAVLICGFLAYNWEEKQHEYRMTRVHTNCHE